MVLLAALNVSVLLAATRTGLTVLLFVAFAVVISAVTAVSSGAALLAIGFLYPQAVSVTGLPGLVWLVVPASLSSVLLFSFLLDGLMIRVLRSAGMDMPRISVWEAFAEGVFLTLALMVVARLQPDTSVSPVAALAAGLIGAFVRFYISFYLDDTGSADASLMAEVDQAVASQEHPLDREKPL